MDSYYEELVDYLRYEIPRDLHKKLQEFLLDAQGYGNWSEQADILDRIIANHIMEGIIKEGLLEEELVSDKTLKFDHRGGSYAIGMQPKVHFGCETSHLRPRLFQGSAVGAYI